MSGYKRVNYYELCRLCTSSHSKDKIHIFHDEGKKMQLQHKIQTCFPLIVCETDYLPKTICTTCIQTLEQCFYFRQNCINSESMLSSYFSNFRFTDDFKKSGKVYVKDTTQTKHEPISSNINNNSNNNKQKNQDAEVSSDFYLELPKYPPQQQQIEYISKNPPTIPAAPTSSNMAPIAANLNFNPKIEIQNMDQPQKNQSALMYIDIDQLIDAGLPEQEINKLKDVFLKPIDCNTNAKQFKCETCEKIFKRREHLYQHSKLHTGLRPFSCENCAKTFSRKEHLLRHITSHSGAKDFCCDVCQKKFSRPDNLKKHKKTHQKTGPFICEICAKSFVIKHYYLAHKMQHDDNSVK